MTLFGGDSLVISLPGAEVAGMTLPGSLAGPDAVLANPISLELRSALELLLQHAASHALPVTCVARPEMFTHGRAEAWFRDRVSPSGRHVCLSDGSTVKPLPGLATHVFFYCLSFREAAANLRKLSRRAPELLESVHSQVNTCLVLGREPHRVRPETVYLVRKAPLVQPPARLLPFFLNRDSAEDSANRIEHAGAVATESLTGFTQLLYLPLTETSLDDRAFARAVVDLLLRAFFEADSQVVIRLPHSSLLPGLTTLLAAVRQTGVVLPRSSPPNILLTTQDLAEGHALFERSPYEVLVHDSFDFWRHSADFYAHAQVVTVLAEPEAVAGAGCFDLDISSIYGAKGVRRWVADPAGVD